jgi:hypothetical protein
MGRTRQTAWARMFAAWKAKTLARVRILVLVLHLFFGVVWNASGACLCRISFGFIFCKVEAVHVPLQADGCVRITSPLLTISVRLRTFAKADLLTACRHNAR